MTHYFSINAYHFRGPPALSANGIFNLSSEYQYFMIDGGALQVSERSNKRFSFFDPNNYDNFQKTEKTFYRRTSHWISLKFAAHLCF